MSVKVGAQNLRAPEDAGEAPSEALGLRAAQTLLDALPGVAYFVADAELRFVSANGAMAALCGLRRLEEMLGRQPGDCPAWGAAAFCGELGAQVLATRMAVTERIFVNERGRGAPQWRMFGCWPIYEDGRRIVGVTGVARTLETTERKRRAYERVAAAVRHISANVASRIRVDDLAQRVGVSVSQIERDFVDVFGLTPVGYIARTRLEAAMTMLRGSNVSIAEVAHACGYADQSAFTRRFQYCAGMTPSEYRRRMLARVTLPEF